MLNPADYGGLKRHGQTGTEGSRGTRDRHRDGKRDGQMKWSVGWEMKPCARVGQMMLPSFKALFLFIFMQPRFRGVLAYAYKTILGNAQVVFVDDEPHYTPILVGSLKENIQSGEYPSLTLDDTQKLARKELKSWCYLVCEMSQTQCCQKCRPLRCPGVANTNT